VPGMKWYVFLCTLIVLFMLPVICLVGCGTKNTATSTPSEPSVKPPIIFSTVPPPSTVPGTTSTPTSVSVNYTLTISVSPSGAGTVTLAPSGGNYPSGTVVTLTAVPTPDYQFENWSGDVIGTSTAVTLTMDSNKSIIAYFKGTT
jgi:hypothetical protein